MKKQLMKQAASLLLAAAMLTGLLSPAAIAAQGQTGDFNVTWVTQEAKHTYDSGVLTVHDGANLEFSNQDPNAATTHRIVVDNNAHVKITLSGVNISASRESAIDLKPGATVTLHLDANTTNILQSGSDPATLHVPESASLTIDGGGALEVSNTSYGAAIGGKGGGDELTPAKNSGTITIAGSAQVTATSSSGAAIGGGGAHAGNGGNGGGITIRDSANVIATSTSGGAAIGGGDGGGGNTGGSGGTIRIAGNARVTATAAGGAAIGGGAGGAGGDGGIISIDGNVVIFAETGGSHNPMPIGGGAGGGGTPGDEGTVSRTKGVILEKGFLEPGFTGAVHGSVTLPGDLTLSANDTLTIPQDKTLTVPQGATLTNNGTIDGGGALTGDGTFTGGGTYALKADRTITAPTVASKTYNSVTLSKVTPKGDGTVTYAKSTTETAPADGWQQTLTFTGLDPNTTYYFFARVTGSPVYKNATSADGTAETTAALSAITIQSITGVTAPVRGAQPVGTMDATEQYTGTVSWSPDPGQAFSGGTEYTATITLTAKEGYTFDGVEKDYFTVDGATATNAADSGIVTAVFPRTGRASSGSSTPSPAEQAADKVAKAKDGDAVQLDLPSGGKLPGEVLEKAAGKDITLEIDAGDGAVWIIHGKDVPTGKQPDLNLKIDTDAKSIPVTVINALTGEKKVVQLTLSHSGDFAFPLTLRLDVSQDSAGLWANLYYYNEEKKALEYQSAAKIGADGVADIPFAHASSYAVVIDEASHGALPFTDVREGDWFYEAAAHAYRSGLMRGTSDTAFSPAAPMTRGMFVTTLFRLAGNPQGGESYAFTDVPIGAYYADAVAWAAAQGIVTGDSPTVFSPDRPVTRQELAAILYRYAQYEKLDVSVGEDTNILSYADAFEIGTWAMPAMQWACGAGLMDGKGGGLLDPKGTATRAEVAAVLLRFAQMATTA